MNKLIKIGITGQSGFIGSSLKNYIQRNSDDEFDVIEFKDVFFQSDKKLEDFVSKSDVIIHLAGMSRGDDSELYQTNIDLTNKLISALEKTGNKAGVIFASSIHEKTDNAFGKSKRDSRMLLNNWAKKNKTKFSGLLIPHVFGPNARPFHNSALSTFCYQLTHDQKPKLTNDSELKLIFVDDLAVKILDIAKSNQWVNKIDIKPYKRILVSELLKKLMQYKRSYLDKDIKPDLNTPFDINLFKTLYSYLDKKDSQTEGKQVPQKASKIKVIDLLPEKSRKFSKLKIMTIVGTRPEIIRLSRVMHELDKHFNHVIVHTGQNYDYELNEIFFKELGIKKPDFFLNAATENVAGTIGNIINLSDELFEKEKPDAVLLYGDTNSCLSIISAKRKKIPVFHMEAGNRAFDQRVPEDINRKIVDHLSDINMPLTEHARRHLLAEGIKPETIIKTGSPMMEILNFYMPKIKTSKVLTKLKLTKKKYFVVSAHREENIDYPENFDNLLDSLNAVAREYKMPVIVSTHPRTRKKIENLKDKDFDKRIQFLKPLGMFDYVKLQQNAYCVLSDSGTLTEESSILNFPAIMIRQAHERPEGMDEGTLIMSGLKPANVLQSIQIITSDFSSKERVTKTVPDYDVKNVSKKVARTIMSYTDYINRTVWHKNEI
ncbi:TPA: UDP-N-acetylglucosamine 2-epimerase (non-hydrolyzing) [Candidatus Berkelbacteria bacterium]|uniref:UDP-N-acetylglucosamine 2-epimerase, UDP-N-acetylglucosamine 2-epimerase n=1 Tax=Berkelbacteria bacterium GW2011_GWE1_39_12 TaxID=1618337 RepID=A0A0G4B5G9_9BACT|nr:MAG: UDP-N-acetylglucosamine 2-epimerase, UDP-N-acetylglucosamine 2-epimerase [Berkelbacteria bacterium GW2011_GWE1_39_12]HBO60790.1 UDP-N-acetylglucosamine 2-epimerase (non-hydrolyzing) [Candidatus Berkelbacteria bacterium]